MVIQVTTGMQNIQQNSQAQSLVNNCGIGQSSGICANYGPMIQGDGSATTPVITQSGGQRGPPGPQGPAGSQGPQGIQGEQGPAGPTQELEVRTV